MGGLAVVRAVSRAWRARRPASRGARGLTSGGDGTWRSLFRVGAVRCAQLLINSGGGGERRRARPRRRADLAVGL